MDASSPSRHHSRTVLTIDLWSFDQRSIQHDDATLRQLLSEVLQAYPTEPSCELSYTADVTLPYACASTSRTSDLASSSVDLTKPYLPDGTKSPDDPANWEWTTGPVDPTYPTKK
jgi:hypothetical protein